MLFFYPLAMFRSLTVMLLVLSAVWRAKGSAGKVTLPCHFPEGFQAMKSKGEKGDPGNKGKPGDVISRGDQGTLDLIRELQSRIAQLENKCATKIEQVISSVRRRDCDDLANQGARENGIYQVNINGKLTEVYCDFQTNGGNWLVIQRRVSNDVNFFRDWESYRKGFGNKSGNFWLGLENIHGVTNLRSYQLRIELTLQNNTELFAEYSTFKIGNLTTNYTLMIDGYSGDAGDAMEFHNNQPFSTYDRGNDHPTQPNCADRFKGAWWYKICHHANLNGLYAPARPGHCKGIRWKKPGSNLCNSMKRAEMKVRPA